MLVNVKETLKMMKTVMGAMHISSNRILEEVHLAIPVKLVIHVTEILTVTEM